VINGLARRVGWGSETTANRPCNTLRRTAFLYNAGDNQVKGKDNHKDVIIICGISPIFRGAEPAGSGEIL
jgi:hypothetical protein